MATALGWAISTAARRRRDARLFLISLAFIASSGFLGLHALATPTVLLGPNAGFELATPFGLVVAGVFAAASAIELGPERARSVVRHARLLLAGLAALMALWAVVSLAELPPLDGPLEAEELDGWQLVLAAVGARALRARGARLRAPVPETPRALRVRVHARLRVPRGGDGRHRLGERTGSCPGGSGTC